MFVNFKQGYFNGNIPKDIFHICFVYYKVKEFKGKKDFIYSILSAFFCNLFRIVLNCMLNIKIEISMSNERITLILKHPHSLYKITSFLLKIEPLIRTLSR